jgi:hypothetical protein
MKRSIKAVRSLVCLIIRQIAVCGRIVFKQIVVYAINHSLTDSYFPDCKMISICRPSIRENSMVS